MNAQDTMPLWRPGNVSEHFAAREFRCPADYGLPETPYPPEWIPLRLRRLCNVLEVLRAELGGLPLEVLPGGGYRTPEWNERHRAAGHGAAVHSQHMEGLAADIRHATRSPLDVHSALLRLHDAGKIRIGGLGLYTGFVHVDIREGSSLAMWAEPHRDAPGACGCSACARTEA